MADPNESTAKKLTDIADKERKKNLVKNTYSVNGDSLYSAQHPNALSDGDEAGKGNAVFLDVFTEQTGTKTDIFARKENTVVNHYSKNNQYTVEDDDL
tara:strand:- start:109 stop:402 length:294 start_codon:yes stop_codon:yes gene_type:complete